MKQSKQHLHFSLIMIHAHESLLYFLNKPKITFFFKSEEKECLIIHALMVQNVLPIKK